MFDEAIYSVTPFCQHGVTNFAGAPALQPYTAPNCGFSAVTNWLENAYRSRADMILNYQNTRNFGLNYGVSKTQTPISQLNGAAQVTALDAWMGNGDMYVGRNYRDVCNQAVGYMQCLYDVYNWLMQYQQAGKIQAGFSQFPDRPVVGWYGGNI